MVGQGPRALFDRISIVTYIYACIISMKWIWLFIKISRFSSLQGAKLQILKYFRPMYAVPDLNRLVYSVVC